MIEEVGGTIEWARNKLDAFPKAKKDLGPLLDALGRKFHSHIAMSKMINDNLTGTIEPLTQIVAGVGMLLAGVLNLLGSLLSGLGLDSLLKGIFAATVSSQPHPLSFLPFRLVYTADVRFNRVSIRYTRD